MGGPLGGSNNRACGYALIVGLSQSDSRRTSAS